MQYYQEYSAKHCQYLNSGILIAAVQVECVLTPTLNPAPAHNVHFHASYCAVMVALVTITRSTENTLEYGRELNEDSNISRSAYEITRTENNNLVLGGIAMDTEYYMDSTIHSASKTLDSSMQNHYFREHH
jgi:hypothetical protein